MLAPVGAEPFAERHRGVGIADDPEHQDERADGERHDTQRLAELIQLDLERRQAFFAGLQQFCNLAKLRIHAGGGDDTRAAPVGDQHGTEGHVVTVSERRIGLQNDFGIFINRHRFAGE